MSTVMSDVTGSMMKKCGILPQNPQGGSSHFSSPMDCSHSFQHPRSGGEDLSQETYRWRLMQFCGRQTKEGNKYLHSCTFLDKTNKMESSWEVLEYCSFREGSMAKAKNPRKFKGQLRDSTHNCPYIRKSTSWIFFTTLSKFSRLSSTLLIFVKKKNPFNKYSSGHSDIFFRLMRVLTPGTGRRRARAFEELDGLRRERAGGLIGGYGES
jgi:hypothetical protein